VYDGRSLLLKVAIFFIASPFFILFPGRLDASFLISDGCAVKNYKLISLVSFVSSTFFYSLSRGVKAICGWFNKWTNGRID
jgi:hypothetical protein